MPLHPTTRPISLAVLTACGTLLLPQFAQAQSTSPQSGADILASINRCRGIAEGAERLACFDTAASNLAAAGDVAVVRRDEVQQNQRRLFGFNVSVLNPFENDGRSQEIQSISATMTKAQDLGRGEWIITLDDGSIWRKVDATTPIFSARRQYPVTVRRAALGSYMMKVGDTPPFRVRRE